MNHRLYKDHKNDLLQAIKAAQESQDLKEVDRLKLILKSERKNRSKWVSAQRQMKRN